MNVVFTGLQTPSFGMHHGHKLIKNFSDGDAALNKKLFGVKGVMLS